MAITGNFQEVGNFINMMPNNINRAANKTINDTLFDLRRDYLTEFGRIFDRPNMNYLNRAFNIVKATPTSLFGSIEIRDDSIGKGTRFTDVLRAHIEGNYREIKKFEKALAYQDYMSRGMIAAPASGAKLDQYGGLDGKFNAMLLSYFNAYSKAGFTAGMTKKKKDKIADRGTHWGTKVRTGKNVMTINGVIYFMVGMNRSSRTNHLKPGIYKKSGLHGSNLEPVILFVNRREYKKRFDFYGIAERAVSKNFQSQFYRNVHNAITSNI